MFLEQQGYGVFEAQVAPLLVTDSAGSAARTTGALALERKVRELEPGSHERCEVRCEAVDLERAEAKIAHRLKDKEGEVTVEQPVHCRRTGCVASQLVEEVECLGPGQFAHSDDSRAGQLARKNSAELF